MSPLKMNRRTALGTASACLASAVMNPFPVGFAQQGSNVSFAPSADQWWNWRGPRGDGTASPSATPPIQPDPNRVRWTAPIPGRGHSSPIVTDQAVYLTTSDEEAGTQSALAYDRETGSLLWNTQIHEGGLTSQIHPTNTEATPTAAYDGKSLFVTFYSDKAIRLTSLTPQGKIQWQKVVSEFQPQQLKFGYAASPVLYKNFIIVVAESDSDQESALVAFDRETGNEVWRSPRPSVISYSSPVVGHVAGKDQLLISGCNLVASYDPNTGAPLWEVPAATSVTGATVVWNDTHVFSSGGFPASETLCIRADGSSEIEWSNNLKLYEQSMLVLGDYVYGVTDASVCYCWRASDGEAMWRHRMGGSWSSSPVLVGDTIYVFNQEGEGWAFQATPEKYNERSTFKVADEVFSSPAVVGDTMYLRVNQKITDDSHQELLLAFI